MNGRSRPGRARSGAGPAALVLLWCAACAGLAAPPARAEPVPEALSGISVALGPREGDVATGPVRPLALGEALDVALSENLDLALARAEEQVAHGKHRVAQGELLPSLEVGALAGRTDGRVQGSFGKLRDVTFSTYRADVALTYRSNLGSRLRQAMAEKNGLRAATLLALDVQQKLLVRVSQLYHDVLLATAGVRIAGDVVKGSEEFLRIVEARSRGGVGEGSDVTLARAKLAADRQAWVQARLLRDGASMRLATVLHLDPAMLLEPADDRLEPRSFGRESQGSAAPEGIPDRPDVQAARSRVHAAEDALSAARWEIYGPDLVAEIRRTEIGTDIDDLERGSRNQALLLWDLSPARFSRLPQRRAERRVAEISARAVEDRARGEVLAARADLRASREEIPLAHAGLQAATDNLRLNQARFQAGTALALEVLGAEDTLAGATLNLARAILRYNMAQVKLLASTGKIRREAFPSP